MTRPAQPREKLPRCIKCQSFAEPSLELYWHIGETTTRLGSVSPRIVIGENRTLAIGRHLSFSRRFLAPKPSTPSKRRDNTVLPRPLQQPSPPRWSTVVTAEFGREAIPLLRAA